ncbi:PAS domain S-box-containing protein [Rhizobium sp. BK650]|uniref:PAS domain-containing sensor histidine kinase n=1 Tax=Rhizobium sp. BK650 TaxID=2586990 RepID=UPI0017B84830|nr:PAS domain-containing sensor histidine kinase [Rhizobium sp. BK650]MBB3656687.1 PAS domain S-box-containing protein [Rhizobium sp. BK650]
MGGEMAGLFSATDWSRTSLGPMDQWPNCLKSAVDIMLPSRAEIVLFWGRDFVALYNDAYAPTIGHKHPRAFGRPARENWSELWDDLEPLLSRVLDSGETVAAKDRPFYLERYGVPETVYFDISYSPVRDEQGHVRGVFCIVNETTNRVRSEAALRENEQRLQAIFAQSAAGIAQADLGGRILSVNQRLCELVGYSAEELVGMTIEDITFEEDRAETLRLYRRMVETGESFDIEKRYVRKDGELVWAANSVFPIRNETGRINQAAAIIVDIAERKRVREVEAHLASMIASSNDAIMGIDLDMRITSWNAAAKKLYGYDEAEVIGQSVLMLVPDDRKHEEPAILRRIAAGLIVEPYETVRVRKDGGLVDVLLSVSPIFDSAGHAVGASKIAHDISARKEAERLQAMLVGELNHRVKNVLATVSAVARQTFGRSEANQADVETFGARLASLGRAHDLLTHGGWQKADLRSVVEQALSPFASEKFEVRGGPVLLPAKTVVAFSLALHELATNAAKYGALSVPDGRVSIAWEQDGSGLRFRWMERGGPTVRPPARKGFGSLLIERLLASELNGQSVISYNADGVVCEISADPSFNEANS